MTSAKGGDSSRDDLWTEAPEVVRLFPSFVWKRRLRPEVFQPINHAFHACLADLRRGLPPLRRGEAWQSGHGLHTHEAVHGLASCIGAAVDRVLDFLRVHERRTVITGCWANLNAPGAAHAMHAHPNNFLSGVYYVQVQEGANTINFHDPRAQAAVIRPPVSELTAYNTDQVVVVVEVGTLLVFPAWLPHSVDANRSEQPRISVSFNAMFAEFGETMGLPLWGSAEA